MEPHVEPRAEVKTLNLHGLVCELMADFAPSARARDLSLDALVFCEHMGADADLLRRLLSGLVSEALRRAPPGTVVTVIVSPRVGHIEFRVADEGSWLPPEVREKVCDVGDGRFRYSGVGLTFCKLAAEAHGGWLSVRQTHAGTVVCLGLPAAPSVEARSRTAVTGAEGQLGLLAPRSHRSRGLGFDTRTHNILLVEDDELLARYFSRVLRIMGYFVVTAGSAEQALGVLCAEGAEPPALLLTDVGLPGISGAELVERARRLYPRLPAVLMSGSSRTALVRDGVIDANTNLLQKPFAVQELLPLCANVV